MKGIKTILVPVDGSKSSLEAARFAGRLASGWGATLELMFVYDTSAAMMMGMLAVRGDEIDRAAHAAGEKHLTAARNLLQDAVEAGCELRDHIQVGSPAADIIFRAKDIGADLIVMGCRGRSPIAELLMGSVSIQVTHHACCPVTVVR